MQSYSQSLSLEELRHVCGKTSYDFAGRATSFLKKHDGEYVQLYLTRNKRDGPIRHGYQFPSPGGAEEYNLQTDVDELVGFCLKTFSALNRAWCSEVDFFSDDFFSWRKLNAQNLFKKIVKITENEDKFLRVLLILFKTYCFYNDDF